MGLGVILSEKSSSSPGRFDSVGETIFNGPTANCNMENLIDLNENIVSNGGKGHLFSHRRTYLLPEGSICWYFPWASWECQQFVCWGSVGQGIEDNLSGRFVCWWSVGRGIVDSVLAIN